MENNLEVRTDAGLQGTGWLTTGASPSSVNGDAFNAAFACHSSANPFKDQLGDDSEDLFKNLVRQFGDELNNNAGKPDGSTPLNKSNDHDIATYTQSRADEDAAELYAATQGGVTGWGTDEDKLFNVFEGKSPEDIEQLRQIFKDHYGQELDTVINDELSGDDLSRAQALIKGDPVENKGYGPEDLKQGLIADMNGWGTDEEGIFERLAQAAPEQRQSLRNDPQLMGQLKSELSSEQFEQVNGLLQGNSAKTDAARIRQAMNGFWGADEKQVRNVLEGKSPEELNAIKAEYQQQTGQSLVDQVGQWSEADADVTLRMLNPEALNDPKDRAEASAERLNLAVSGLGTDENAIRNELAGKSKAEINQMADAFQQKYGQDLRSTLDSELDGRDEFEILNQAFDQGAIDPNDPDAAQKQVDRLKARQDFEEGLGTQVLDTIQHLTKGQSDNDRLKLNLERAQNAIDAGQTGKAQRYAGYAQSDVKDLQQSKDSVAETTATVATAAASTAVVIGTAGMAAPLAAAAMAAGIGVTTRAGTYAALQGKAAGAQELSRQGAIGFVEGGIAAIPLGQGLGKGLSAAAETSENAVKAAAIIGAKEGFVQGAAGGGIDAATKSETWENGFLDGLGKVSTRATIDGALSMASGSLSGASIAGIKQKLGRSLAEIDTSVDKKLDDVLDQTPNAPSNQSVDNQLTDTTVDNISESKIEIGGPKKTNVTNARLDKRHLEISQGISKRVGKSSPVQSTNDINQLFKQAEVADVELKKLTDDIAKSTNGKAVYPPGLKTKTRAVEKINTDYGGDASKLLDISRSSISYESADDLYSALSKIDKNADIVRIKDRFASPATSGYRDILVNIRQSNGHITELQLHSKQVLEVKGGAGHKLYEQIREIIGKAVFEKRPLNAAELKLQNSIVKESESLYNDAFESFLRK